MGVLFLDIEQDQCRFIAGDPTADAMCCGDPVQLGSPYCPAHHARCYVVSSTPSLGGVDPYTVPAELRSDDPVELTEFFA
jgi:hypothetical protein